MTDTVAPPTLPTIKNLDELPKGHHVFEVANASGDSKHTWNPTNEDEVHTARRMFNTLKQRGHSIFAMKADGSTGERMEEFDENVGRLIAVPQLQGG